MMVSTRNLLFHGCIFRCYVSFKEGTPIPIESGGALQVAPQIATLGEGGYRKALMEHLVDRKLAHQDACEPKKKPQGWDEAGPNPPKWWWFRKGIPSRMSFLIQVFRFRTTLRILDPPMEGFEPV